MEASTASPYFPFFEETFPDELKENDVWVCCDSKKRPMVAQVRGTTMANHSDSSTWRPYQQALAAFETGRYAGIGRVIEWDGPYSGVDLDHCRDRRTGRITSKAWRILRHLDSYSEVSPSGEGVKVWVRGAIDASYPKAGLEIYYGRRYFTTTGQVLPQFPGTVEERTEALAQIIAEEFPKRGEYRSSYEGPSGRTLELDQVLDSGKVEILAEVSDGSARIKYRILCPWHEEHTHNACSGTYVGQYENGALFFSCHHAHCAYRRWAEFRAVILPVIYLGRRSRSAARRCWAGV